jgi:ubiquinol-cytochrome c reductase subunit 8
MGRKFGNLGTTVRGIIHYSLSPFEQRAFAGVISHGVPNTLRRIRSQIFRVAPRK